MKMRRPILQNLKVCGFYESETHRCLADGTSICIDPHLVKEQDCETARECIETGSAMSTRAAKLDARLSSPTKK